MASSILGERPVEPEMPRLWSVFVPVEALIGLLGLSFYLFGDAAPTGPNQGALVFCSILAVAVAWWHGHSIGDLREAAVASVPAGLPAIFILLSVGALLLSPDYFYPTACLICLAVAMSIGNSWTVAGTLGIGLIGISGEMGLDPATSPLIPWNSCGAYMAATLGVATTAYVRYCFFDLINPLISVPFAFAGLRMLRMAASAVAKRSDPGASEP